MGIRFGDWELRLGIEDKALGLELGIRIGRLYLEIWVED